MLKKVISAKNDVLQISKNFRMRGLIEVIPTHFFRVLGVIATHDPGVIVTPHPSAITTPYNCDYTATIDLKTIKYTIHMSYTVLLNDLPAVSIFKHKNTFCGNPRPPSRSILSCLLIRI